MMGEMQPGELVEIVDEPETKPKRAAAGKKAAETRRENGQWKAMYERLRRQVAFHCTALEQLAFALDEGTWPPHVCVEQMREMARLLGDAAQGGVRDEG